jgi:hypothetical protein
VVGQTDASMQKKKAYLEERAKNAIAKGVAPEKVQALLNTLQQ